MPVLYLDYEHCLLVVTPDFVGNHDSAPGVPPGCFAACNYGRKSCIYMASLWLERTLEVEEEDSCNAD